MIIKKYMKSKHNVRGKIKVACIDKVALLSEHIEDLKRICQLDLFSSPYKNTKEIKDKIGDADILLVNTKNIDSELLGLFNNLKLICVFGTGYDFIDIDTANKLGVSVCNTPEYSTESTAELAVYLMLGITRFASLANKNLLKGEWNPHKYCGNELKGKKLGIIGYGSIGRRIGRIAKQGFSMEILFVNSKSTNKEFNKLLKNSDIISVNVPLTSKTENMISKKEFSIIKKGAFIINTSRGKIIDEKELIEALRSGKLAGGGFDVFAEEPIRKDHPFLKMENVLLTPHMGFKSTQSAFRVSNIVKNNIIAFIKNKPINIVNQ